MHSSQSRIAHTVKLTNAPCTWQSQVVPAVLSSMRALTQRRNEANDKCAIIRCDGSLYFLNKTMPATIKIDPTIDSEAETLFTIIRASHFDESPSKKGHRSEIFSERELLLDTPIVFLYSPEKNTDHIDIIINMKSFSECLFTHSFKNTVKWRFASVVLYLLSRN